MASRKDWMPSQEDKLVDLFAVWKTKLATAELQTAYDWVATECTETVAAIAGYLTARAAYQAAPTKSNKTERDEAKSAAEVRQSRTYDAVRCAYMRRLPASAFATTPKWTTARKRSSA